MKLRKVGKKGHWLAESMVKYGQLVPDLDYEVITPNGYMIKAFRRDDGVLYERFTSLSSGKVTWYRLEE
jgi:hypothetical protein